MRTALTMVLASAACAGSLTLGLAGVAGAAGSSSSSLKAQAGGLSKSFAQDLKHFNCGNARRHLSRGQRLTAKFQKRDATLTADLARVQKAGKAKRVKFFQKRLAAVQKEQGKLMGKKFESGMAKVAKVAQEKCHISPPPTT